MIESQQLDLEKMLSQMEKRVNTFYSTTKHSSPDEERANT